MNKKFLTSYLILATIFLLLPSGVFGAAVQNTNPTGDQSPTLSGNVEVGEVVWVNNVLQVRTRANGTGTVRPLQLTTGTSNVGVFINSSGQVGIGTSTLSNALTVVGNILATGSITGTGGITGNVTAAQVGGGSVFGSIAGKGNYTFQAAANTNPVLSVDATNERVGVGTASPSTKLEIFGTNNKLRLSYDATKATDLYTDSTGNLYVDPSGGYVNLYDGSTAFKLALYNGATSAVKLDTNGNSYLNGGNVGIGTSTPSRLLQITGDGSGPTNSSMAGAQLMITGSTNSLRRLGLGYDTTNNYGWIQAAEPGIVGLTNLILEAAGGNVGIGTTAPTQLLTLSSSNTLGTAVSIINTSTGGYYWNIFSGGSDATLAPVGSLIFRDSTNGVSRMVIKGNGDVGIGTTTPAYDLDVTGNIRATGNVIAGGTMTANVNAGNVSAGTFGSTAGKGNFTFQAAANSNSVLAVDATNERVGVGTASPSEKLHLYSNVASVKTKIESTLSTGTASVNAVNDVGKEFKFGIAGSAFATYRGIAANDGYILSDLASSSLAVSVDNAIKLYTAGSERLRIDNSGNVGIGTSTPAQKLDVNGKIALNGTTVAYRPTTMTGTFVLGDGGGSLSHSAGNEGYYNTYVGLSSALSVSSGAFNTGVGWGALSWGNSGSSNTALGYVSLFQDTTGFENVAVGSFSGNAITTGSKNIFIGSSAGYNGLQKADAVNSMALGSYTYTTADNQFIYGNASVTQHIFQSGSVGIGTTTAAYKLDVNGTGSFANPVIVGSPSAANHATTKSYVDSLLTGGGTSGNLSTLYVAGTSTLAATGGKVLIGGAGPSLKLDVTGQGQFSDTMSATKYYDYNDPTYYIDPANTGTSLKFAGAVQSDGTGINYLNGQLAVGTTNPGTYRLYVAGTSWFNNQVTINGTLTMNASSSISLGGGNIGQVGKLTVTTIDPLYNIDGKNYSTYASAIAGGVKEEYVGRAKLSLSSMYPVERITYKNTDTKYDIQNTIYDYVIDFENIERGSDLWVWYNAVDFNKYNVEAMATAYGTLANIGYKIDGKSLVFFSDKPTEFSYRLVGKRFDHEAWPTFAKDQTEKASFILKSK